MPESAIHGVRSGVGEHGISVSVLFREVLIPSLCAVGLAAIQLYYRLAALQLVCCIASTLSCHASAIQYLIDGILGGCLLSHRGHLGVAVECHHTRYCQCSIFGNLPYHPTGFIMWAGNIANSNRVLYGCIIVYFTCNTANLCVTFNVPIVCTLRH